MRSLQDIVKAEVSKLLDLKQKLAAVGGGTTTTEGKGSKGKKK